LFGALVAASRSLFDAKIAKNAKIAKRSAFGPSVAAPSKLTRLFEAQ
jgi:hypothetical protein